MNSPTVKPRLLVLDTNVLMHDPTALFRFQEHAIYLPMVVLEELDASKKGLSEVATNVRQVSRFLDELMAGASKEDIDQGLPLSRINHDMAEGRLFFQTQALEASLPAPLPGNRPDNEILRTTLALQHSQTDRDVVLVSKDINLRIKAKALGIAAEDYHNDQVLEDVDLLYTGTFDLTGDFWQAHTAEELGQALRIRGPEVCQWHPNQFLRPQDESRPGWRIQSIEGDTALAAPVVDHRLETHPVWGIRARNREQNFALDLLLDPDVDFVTVLGTAGTGKTLLTLAAGLAQTLDEGRFQEIIMTRVTIPVGEDIGYLPGTEEEKMTPWMGALMDNLEVLTHSDVGGAWGRAAAGDLLEQRVKIRSLNFMRGRTFLNRLVIIDEAQNLTSKQMKTLVTRAGPGTKLVCLGNLSQIDTPYLSETTSGLTYVVDRFRRWPHSGHIILRRGERSRLADFASDNL